MIFSFCQGEFLKGEFLTETCPAQHWLAGCGEFLIGGAASSRRHYVRDLSPAWSALCSERRVSGIAWNGCPECPGIGTYL